VSSEVWLGSPEAARWFDIDKLSDEESLRYAGLKGERRRQEFAVSRALRQTAAERAQAHAATSLSHSGGWAAVARADAGCRVGVDLEFHRPRNLLGIARFAFDPSEIALLEAREPDQRHELFFILWTLKEAMAKALGVPLLAATRDCVFSVEESMGVQVWKGRVPTEQPWHVRAFHPRKDIALSVAVIGGDDVAAVSTYEWPGAGLVRWPTVVALGSGASA
jgi:phosphopantetheinyl transferase (holo-ACP synthase)